MKRRVKVFVTRAEYDAIHYAIDFISNVLESCSDEDNGKEIDKKIGQLSKLAIRIRKNLNSPIKS